MIRREARDQVQISSRSIGIKRPERNFELAVNRLVVGSDTAGGVSTFKNQDAARSQCTLRCSRSQL